MICASKCQLPFFTGGNSWFLSPSQNSHSQFGANYSIHCAGSRATATEWMETYQGCGPSPISLKSDKIWKKKANFLSRYAVNPSYCHVKSGFLQRKYVRNPETIFQDSQRLPPGPRKICPFRRKRIAVLCEKRYNITEDTAPMRAPPAHSAKKGESQQYG